MVQGIERLRDKGKIHVEGEAIYLVPFYHAEVGVANHLRTMVSVQRSRLAFYARANWEWVFAYLNQRMPLPLTPKQQEAVKSALTSKVTVLTGGPGTGKTTTVRTVIRLLRARSKSVLLAAPTGRAARRLSEATGGAGPDHPSPPGVQPQRGLQVPARSEQPLYADMIIVDEASMIDLLLMNWLLCSGTCCTGADEGEGAGGPGGDGAGHRHRGEERQDR